MKTTSMNGYFQALLQCSRPMRMSSGEALFEDSPTIATGGSIT